jgi:predicted transcriptional regulator
MKRSKEEILKAILELCKEPAGLTKIVYQCNLNFFTVKSHLKVLTDAGLIDISGIEQISYKTTTEGMKALEHINAFRSLLMSTSNSLDEPAVQEGL